jgi:hypothetical protein
MMRERDRPAKIQSALKATPSAPDSLDSCDLIPCEPACAHELELERELYEIEWDLEEALFGHH